MAAKPETPTNSQKARGHCITDGQFGMVTCEFQLLSITCNKTFIVDVAGHRKQYGGWSKPEVVISPVAPHIETKFQSLGIGFRGQLGRWIRPHGHPTMTDTGNIMVALSTPAGYLSRASHSCDEVYGCRRMIMWQYPLT
jgi:hypothetical protein